MKKIVYIVFSLCSIGFTGSLLLAEHINLIVGLIGFAVTYFLGVYALESFDMKIRETDETENTFIPEKKKV